MIDLFSSSLAIRNYQPATRKKNVLIANKFMAWLGSLEGLNTARVEDYLMHLLATGRSVKTTKNHLSAIKVFCNFLANRGLLTDNPAHGVKTLEAAKILPVCLTNKEVETAYEIARKNDFLVEVTVALKTGLRLEELRNLRWSEVDLERRQLIVAKAKGKCSRTVPLNQITCTRLQIQHNEYHHLDYVFPGGKGGFQGRGVWDQDKPRGLNWWQKTSVKMLQEHIPTLKKLPRGHTGRGWHALRHTFATRCVKADIDIVKIKDWMGHKQLDTTLQYIHVARHYDPAIELV